MAPYNDNSKITMITTTTNTNINNNNNINIIMMRKKEFKNGKFEKLSTKRQTKRKRPKCEPNSDIGSKNGLEKFWTKAGCLRKFLNPSIY